MPLRGSVPSSPHSPGLTASGSRARLPGEPPASGSVLSLPSRDCVSDLKLPEGGTNCRGTASLGGRGPQVTGNPDETQMRAPASAVVSGSPAVGQEAAARDSNVPVHTRASRPCPPRGPRRRVFSFLRIHGRRPGAAARPSGRGLTKRHRTKIGSPWTDWTWRSVQAELGPKRWSRAGVRGAGPRESRASIAGPAAGRTPAGPGRAR